MGYFFKLINSDASPFETKAEAIADLLVKNSDIQDEILINLKLMNEEQRNAKENISIKETNN